MSEEAPILWRPSEEEVENRNLSAFVRQLRNNLNIDFGHDYQKLWRWSVKEKGLFWRECWKFLDFIYEGSLEPSLLNESDFFKAKWFPNINFNYAENILNWPDKQVALSSLKENGERLDLTFADLKKETSRLQQSLIDLDLRPGTRVAAIMSNTPESIEAMLAVTSLGGVWTSVSPDFGPSGMLDRLTQADPEILFAVNGYSFGGNLYDIRNKISDIVPQLKSLRKIIIVNQNNYREGSSLKNSVTWEQFLDPYKPQTVTYKRLPFDHPLFVLYTSGTTGKPKCIIHTAGGSMLKSVSEHSLLFDLKPTDTAFFPTTLGWMMWNFLVNFLGTGAKIICYDGSPFFPHKEKLWQLAVDEKVTILGLGSSYIEACKKSNFIPSKNMNLSQVRVIIAGGSVLSPEGFSYIYKNITDDVQLISASGGTEIMGCLLGSNPWGAVYQGELQGPALGMDMAVVNEEGKKIEDQKGELVCLSTFPSLPIGLLGDDDGSRFRNTYFSKNPGMYTQGDFAESKSFSGGYIVYGRSDATLNPGGVRIGTAEIYRQVDKLKEVEESVVVGQNWQNDVRVVLFVLLKKNENLSESLIQKISSEIKNGASPRHVPRKILQVNEIPKTRTGKIAEIAVRKIVNGEEISNIESLINPESLDEFKNRIELKN